MRQGPETTWGGPRRRLKAAALTAAVLLAHLWLGEHGMPQALGAGAAQRPPARLEVAFVRKLQVAAPAPVAATRPPPRPRLARLPRAAALAASAPDAVRQVEALAATETPSAAEAVSGALAAVEPAPVLLPPLPSLQPLPSAAMADAASAQASAAQVSASQAAHDAVEVSVATAAPAASAAAVSPEWPPSTRLSYTLTGDYRGPVHGQAQVQWLRDGARYQVHMDLSVGPSFAPLMSRRVSSAGAITPQGLRPNRYDEDTRVALRAPRLVTVWLDADQVRLAAGGLVPRPPGVQDSASQFVQLTWLFTTQPELLQPGRTVVLPLALPRVVEDWTYEVLETETLHTPAGPVQAVHVKPRRPPRPGRDLVAEIWVAPSLQYLPVRILIRQDEQTYIDLLVQDLPEQAEPGR